MTQVVIRIGAAYDEAVIMGNTIDRAQAREQIKSNPQLDFKSAYRSFNEELARTIGLVAAIKGNEVSRKRRYKNRDRAAHAV